MPYEHPDRIIS